MSAPVSTELRAFVEAVCARDVAAVRQVLESSAQVREDINRPLFDFGRRATHLAANHLELLDLLLAFGADITLKSDWDKGPYSVLDEADDAHAREVIARGVTLTANVAARLGWLEELRALIDRNPAAVHERGGDGQQPLHQARTSKIAEYLLAHGAEIDARCWDHQSTPAQYALVDRSAVCRRLLDRGAAPDIFMAAYLGDLPLAKRLVEADASCLAARVNTAGYAPVPPFNIYCWTLGFLRSPHDVARSRGHAAVAAFLTTQSPPRIRFLEAASAGNETEARAALAHDPSLLDSLTADDHGRLALAIMHGHRAAARLMLDLGFDPTAPGVDGGSALHAACWMGDADFARELAGRVPLELRDPTHDGTPIGWAAFGAVHRRAPGGDYVAVIDSLVASGASVHASPTGDSPLIAMAEGRPDVQEALRRHGAVG